MQFLLENYLLIILIGLFFVFALIGYLIDLLRVRPEKKDVEVRKSSDIKPLEMANIDINQANNNQVNNKDELLNNYNKTEVQENKK